MFIICIGKLKLAANFKITYFLEKRQEVTFQTDIYEAVIAYRTTTEDCKICSLLLLSANIGLYTERIFNIHCMCSFYKPE